MKKLLGILGGLVLVIILVGCNSNNTENIDSSNPSSVEQVAQKVENKETFIVYFSSET